MCLHPPEDRLGFDALGRDVIDGVFRNKVDDNCDYYNTDDKIQKTPLDISILQLNVRGLASKKDELEQLLQKIEQSSMPEVIILCETWLTPSSPRVNITGYEFVGKHRTHKKGGGVGLLISKSVKFKMRTDLEVEDINCENCFVEIKLDSGNIVVGSIYRPPNTNNKDFVNLYSKLVNKIKLETRKKIIIGLDHNLDFLKSHTHGPTMDFIEKNLSNDLIPCITRPTRITKNSATLIDNIIVSTEYIGKISSKILMEDISDHLPSYVKLNNILENKLEPKRIESRCMKPKNLIALRKHLTTVKWEHYLNSDIDVMFDTVHSVITESINTYLPKTVKTISPKQQIRKPWITKGILKSITYSKKLYRKILRKDSNTIEYKNYVNYQKSLKRIKRIAKIQYFQSQCNEYRNNTSKLWKIINIIAGKTNDKSSLIEKIKTDNIMNYNPTVIANSLGKYFSEVGANFANKIPASNKSITDYLNNIPFNEKSLFMQPTTESEVLKLIGSLPNKSSSGFDEISNIILKEIKIEIAPILVYVFNESIVKGIFPESMKLAHIVPLYKGKEKYLPENYRPISLLITLSKLLEKIVYTRTYNFLNDTDQIYAKQFGFRKKHSCENAVSELVGNIVKNLEQRKYTIAVFLDLSKAFDTLEHDVIFSKMYQYGIRGNCLDWYRSYLKNRKLQVKCMTEANTNNTYSETYNIDYGTPQGSCMGPLIFLIFCNDLSTHLELISSIQFADDTTLYHSSKNKTYLKWSIEHDLQILSDWFRANKLTLNLNKSTFILFGPGSNENMEIRLGEETIPQVNCTKFLGIWIDQDLRWLTHFQKVCLKVQNNIMLLNRLKNVLTTHALKLLYYAQVNSHLQYGILNWGNMLTATQIDKLQKLQNKCIKIVAKKDKVNVVLCRKELKILSIRELIKIENLKFGYKYDKKLLPVPLVTSLELDHTKKTLMKQHEYATRNKHLPNLPTATNNKYKNSFLFKSVKLYSELPTSDRKEYHLKGFVATVKRRIFES